MKFIVGFFSLGWMRVFDFIAPLVIRLFLAPMLWVEGTRRLGLFQGDFVIYNPLTWADAGAFAKSVEAVSYSSIAGLGDHTLVLLFGCIEIVAAVLLVLGFGVRWVTLALMFVMAVLGLMAGFLEAGEQLVMGHGYTDMATKPEMYLIYFVLLLALFFMGAGRWFSLDWYVYRSFMKRIDNKSAAKADPFEIDATDEPGIGKA